MALPAAPDWLTKRDGALKRGLRDYVAIVTIADRPEYRLELRPANGKFACVVSYTVNGKLIEGHESQPTADAAWADGLTRLQAKLGW
jgi:hypothetical protein